MITLLALTKIKGRKIIKLRNVKNVLFMSVEISSKPFNFLVDTGADVNVLYKKSYDRLGETHNIIDFQALKTIAGESDKYPVIKLVYKIKSQLIKTDVLIIPLDETTEYDGIVGLPILRAIGATIDTKNNLMYADLENDVEDD